MMSKSKLPEKHASAAQLLYKPVLVYSFLFYVNSFSGVKLFQTAPPAANVSAAPQTAGKKLLWSANCFTFYCCRFFSKLKQGQNAENCTEQSGWSGGLKWNTLSSFTLTDTHKTH